MRKIGIIADDLTGASDSGVKFARMGLETRVLFDWKNAAAECVDADVAVMDTDSRSLPMSDAYARVRQAAQYLRELEFQHVYKKLDSTLRGNLGAEIDAVMDTISFDFAVVAPAYPKIGRVTRGGRHFLNGTPIDQTEMARDPKCPVSESDILKLIASQSKRKTGLVPLAVLREGEEAVRAQVDRLRQDGVDVMVFDAESDSDMQRIASIMSGYRARILWTGSAGLADALPVTLGLAGRLRPKVMIAPSGKPVLLVAGSISQTTQDQVRRVCEEPHVACVELNPLALLAGEDEQQRELKRCVHELEEAVQSGRNAAFYSLATSAHVKGAKALGEARGMTDTDISNRIADALGTAAAAIAARHDLQGLILTGGDTAKAVCRHLGVSGIQLLDEIEPGIPLSRIVGAHPLFVVTKAGAFGTRHTLLHALHVLKGDRQHE
ncbi:uncharacterized protein YgbK (DUF1537 family) [Brevibacillus aydinogluensis]|jgi:D-threonate/D-erythronate kinase|uniref:four-carbon acid sugar kinase family protein n=1 Tax=Brevibacillus TaxID=55080 RepID=UPI001BA3AFD9|nr:MULTISPECIES: four-carbon acid sugar kinase family protein [Brevibacillus]MBR8659084.1 four-carbon acid sugar kinase family protein [Brevibacillus sp. NL20B1]MDT3417043.1 uncharacterized protein YgbK (DUF1537 family) [Brevibacillus aydinogluensis]